MSTETELLFEFALYQADSILIRGAVLISQNEETNAFGEHLHVEEWVTFGNEQALVSRAIFKGLILKYKFELPACEMMLYYHDLQQDDTGKWHQVVRLKAALRIGVHDSEDWENLTLHLGYGLAFRCHVR